MARGTNLREELVVAGALIRRVAQPEADARLSMPPGDGRGIR